MRYTIFVTVWTACFALLASGAPLPELPNTGSISTNQAGSSPATSIGSAVLQPANEDKKSEVLHHDVREWPLSLEETKATISRLQRRVGPGQDDGRDPHRDEIPIPHGYNAQQAEAHITATKDRAQADRLARLSQRERDLHRGMQQGANQHHDNMRNAIIEGDTRGERDSRAQYKQAKAAAKQHKENSVTYAKQSAQARAHGQQLIDRHGLTQTHVSLR
ncbi:hypothetical protein FRC14_003388 [Serendipita sp. 396]|nr:hypothetical protein FRC14_003388 [Serendipita sp. 396]KAG8783628.1 hypothetical protein FRC15_004808 [Serendipita sp. 397]KAG8799507.1 hypothetical protein FRC16_004962 [Serendipita sp. 398]KAG8808797.1 hypothetical protein FRC18_004856 [Serendipita sp. 400]KAG8811469.1 hypothetical protein FRC19_003774 [Serendipita sp. 401]KAG8867656.1 hypothetical protein FRC20_005187 [Serendipita sp. 405]KAG9044523.1 hypothetical protein FS842_001467 [Serendipita sp. 407]